tara:strand:- start:321 stop:797 length:477 start_codon:yes stop_codon:yes gene_type:complete
MADKKKKPEDLDAICHKKTRTPLELIFEQTRRLKQAEKSFRQINHPLFQYCQVANYRHNNLTLHTQSSQILMELRLIEKDLLAILQKHVYFQELLQVHFKLFFPEKSKPKRGADPKARMISSSATQNFENLKDHCDNEQTKAALEKFILKHGKPKPNI